MKLETKHLPITLPESLWRVAALYLATQNYSLRTSKRAQVNISRLLSGIIAQHLITHGNYIRQRFFEVKAKVFSEGAPARFFSPEQLAAIESADVSEIPDVLRVAWRERHGEETRAESRALRVTNR